ncbi:hypothetical protein C1J01_04865 [Nonomuraea aridisoli]|uniref:Uncharacterized protein n=1 Tax=Nonomuraea aridisoli TaxID=2070368 RepID=A0A2W2ED51_9ACTN|nr:hypothetical protein C1J01_04865 [Nonomuraea aridisoli]
MIVDILERRTSGHAGQWYDDKDHGVQDYAAAVVNCAENRAGSEEARHASEARAREFYRRQAELDREAAIELLVQARIKDALSEQVRNWRQAEDIRVYCDRLEQRNTAQASDSADSTREWIAWARHHADAIDPLLQNPLPAMPTIKWSDEDLEPYKPERPILFGSGYLRHPF